MKRIGIIILLLLIIPCYAYSAEVSADMVAETTVTTGTGPIQLAGAISGYRTFVDGVGDGNSCTYQIKMGTEWEVGYGIVTDSTPDVLSRTTVYSSSNAGSKVDFSSGTKTVAHVLAADDIEAFRLTVTDSRGFNVLMSGGGDDIVADSTFAVVMPYSMDIEKVTAVAYAFGTVYSFGTIQVDIWVDTYANHPPTNADSITASAPIFIDGATKYQDSTLSGWTVGLDEGDIVMFNVDSCTHIKKCTIGIEGTRTWD